MRAAEDDVRGVGQNRIAGHADAERLAHQAARAVAADDVPRVYLLARAGFGVLDDGRHQIGVLLERDEPRAIAQGHALPRRRERAQDRIEHVLRATFAPLRAFLGRRRLADSREAFARQFIAGEAGQIDVVLRVIARIGRAFDRGHQAPAPAEFHGADADEVHARLIDRAVGLLDQGARNAAPAEIAGKREPDRAAADDQYRLDSRLHVACVPALRVTIGVIIRGQAPPRKLRPAGATVGGCRNRRGVTPFACWLVGISKRHAAKESSQEVPLGIAVRRRVAQGPAQGPQSDGRRHVAREVPAHALRRTRRAWHPGAAACLDFERVVFSREYSGHRHPVLSGASAADAAREEDDPRRRGRHLVRMHAHPPP